MIYKTDKELVKAICAHKVKQLFVITHNTNSISRVYIDTISLVFYVSKWDRFENGHISKEVRDITHAEATSLAVEYCNNVQHVRQLPEAVLDNLILTYDCDIENSKSRIECEFNSVLKKNLLFMLDDTRVH